MKKVTIKNFSLNSIVDEFAKVFVGRAIYSIVNLYSRYNRFQLAIQSRDLTIICTSFELVKMCTLSQGAMNSVAHIMNGMDKVLRDFILKKTMSFLDDVIMKGCTEKEKEKDDILDIKRCCKFVGDHIVNS